MPSQPRFKEPLTPAQHAAIRFGLAAELESDPAVAKLLDFKARLDSAAQKLKPTQERKAKLVAKVRHGYGLDDNSDHRVAVLIESVASALLFLAQLKPRKPAASPKINPPTSGIQEFHQ